MNEGPLRDTRHRRAVRLLTAAALALASLAGCSSGGDGSGPSTGGGVPLETGSPVGPGTGADGVAGSDHGIDFPERVLDARTAPRLLARATFGPSERAIDEAIALGTEQAWIDGQMARPVSLTLPYTERTSNGSHPAARHHAWWIAAIEGEDQLRQRVAFALSELFVVSDVDYTLSNSQYGMAHYRDTLARHAFGNYRELLEAVTLHPVMGIFLSMVRNEKADPARRVRPDENYAREVLQLFSVGLHELDGSGRPVPAGNPRPVYTQETVEAFARVFTGWNFAGTDEWYSIDMTPYDKTTPMVPVEAYHDRGAKTLLRGEVVEGGLDARNDLERALDNVAAHPNVGPFVARRLIERLVTSNPSPDYVRRVAAVFDDDGTGERGDLGATVRAILADDEAWGEREANPDFGKLKEPVLRLTGLMRALEARPGIEADGVYNGATRTAYRVDEVYGQSILSSPSVFNFFQPDHPVTDRATAPDGRPLVAPEAQILTESTVASVNNDLHRLVHDHHSRAGADDGTVVLDIERPLRLLREGPEVWVDWLERVPLAGRENPTLRMVLLEHLAEGGATDAVSAAALDDDTAIALLADTLYLVVGSPEYHVQ